MPTPQSDAVHHPKHYTSHPSGVECIEITRWMNFNIGNAIKYAWRAGLKDAQKQVQDLNKAIWYLRDEIKRLDGICDFVSLKDSTIEDVVKIATEAGMRVDFIATPNGTDVAVDLPEKMAVEVEARLKPRVSAPVHDALVKIFGGEPSTIVVSSIDHLCMVLKPDTVRDLLNAVGGPWAALLKQIDDRAREQATWKNPGEDPRLKEEKKKADA